MSISRKLLVSAIMLGSMQSMAKIGAFKPFKPNFDVNIGTIFKGDIDLAPTSTLSTKNSLFLNNVNKYIAQKARNRAIKFLDENWKEKNSRFKTDAEYIAFKNAFLKGEFSASKFITNNDQTRNLKTPFASLEDLGFSLLSEENFQNRLEAYRNIYELLPRDLHDILVPPNEIRDLNGVEYNFTIVYNFLQSNAERPSFEINPYPENYEPNCEDEIGYQAPMSTSANDVADNAARCDVRDYHQNGLFLNNDYALKYNTTCIKDQASRGSCVSFTINAAIETQSYVNEGRAYNLSEQFTYFYSEVYGGSSNGKAGRYDYGLNNDRTLMLLNSENVKLQLESRWAYNPSKNMDHTLNANNNWENSCVDYSGPMCTNRAFQANEEIESCGWFCTRYKYTVPQFSTSVDDTFEVNGRNSFLKTDNPAGSLDQAIAYVTAGKPVIVGIDVRNYMYEIASRSGDGYITYQTDNDDLAGGHAFLMIGFVNNRDLPADAPRATEKGYFIIKNSWGIGAGDCGYLYIDFQVMKKEITSLHTITSKRPR